MNIRAGLEQPMYLHSLPFCIGYNGPAEIDEAFPVVINNETNTFQSAFRGRKMSGRSHELPRSLNVLCAKYDKSSKIISFLQNSEISGEKLNIIEWNKADVPEPSKFEVQNFSKLSQLQEKVNSIFLND